MDAFSVFFHFQCLHKYIFLSRANRVGFIYCKFTQLFCASFSPSGSQMYDYTFICVDIKSIISDPGPLRNTELNVKFIAKIIRT